MGPLLIFLVPCAFVVLVSIFVTLHDLYSRLYNINKKIANEFSTLATSKEELDDSFEDEKNNINRTHHDILHYNDIEVIIDAITNEIKFWYDSFNVIEGKLAHIEEIKIELNNSNTIYDKLQLISIIIKYGTQYMKEREKLYKDLIQTEQIFESILEKLTAISRTRDNFARNIDFSFASNEVRLIIATNGKITFLISQIKSLIRTIKNATKYFKESPDDEVRTLLVQNGLDKQSSDTYAREITKENEEFKDSIGRLSSVTL